MRRFRILYFSSFGSIKGGGQKSLLLLFKHIDRNKYTPICVTPDYGLFSGRLKEMNIKNPVIPMGETKSFNVPRIILTILRVYNVIKKERINLIHTDSPRNTFYAGLAAKLTGIPVVSHIRIVNKPRFDDRIMALLTDRFIFVSKAAKRRFDWIKNKKSFNVIYNCIDVKEFEKYQSDSKSFSLKSGTKEEYSIGCIGRVEVPKGQIYLIRAAQKIADEFPKANFIFIGEEDDSYMNMLKRECIPIKDHIKFMGYLNNPYEIMKDLDIIVSPSLSEGFSRVILESMAMKKPVIATDVGGNSEAIDDGTTGYLVSPRDPDALSKKIISLLKDREKLIKIGEAGYYSVNEFFNIERNVREIERFYDVYRNAR